MTPLRKSSFIRKVKDITVGSTLALAVLGNTVMLQSCGSSNEEDEGDYEEVEVYTKGVKTYITETSKGEFKITDEVEVPADSSVAIVKYLDGKKDTLSPRAVKALIDNEIATNQANVGHTNNLSNALLYGGMGYLLAKTLSPTYTNYRPDMSNGFNSSSSSYSSANQDSSRRRRHVGYYGGGLGRYYVTASAFQKSNTIHQSIGNSRTITSRPVSGRSGFFHSSSHGGYHG
ncbi:MULTISPECIES: hypothetical protein [unclassified Arcicella]|uniref:hypothetical protein n=1 Tax=unclassified Arcicella TaxID=2644986 RepID=UPI00285E40CE|nr:MULTISPECIES: hypothetical protein [unclassified Arcicella]MDR6564323.1 hypothetical protein [Arcicella sp. BE51]MDR6814074.1 hypothetical protein [Arcicella sp. BE140]MDR6825386.1 hypothetical protein [Arcicella sp. BE139]